jgi:hypothetical protein
MDIPTDKLVREYVNAKGRYAGTYQIYFNPYICEQLTGYKVKKWKRDEDIQTGDFVEGEDGLVVKCLNRYDPYKYKKRTDIHTIAFRFPMATMSIYYGKKGTVTWSNFYVGFTFPSKSKFGGRYAKEETMGDQFKRLWAQLVCQGVHPENAFDAVFKNSPFTVYRTRGARNFNVKYLMQDKVVRHEMTIQLAPYFKKVTNKYSDEFNLGLIDDLLKSDEAKKRWGSDAHRRNIDWFYALQGIMTPTGQESPETKPKEESDTEEVKYEEVQNIPPPAEED